MPLLGWLITHLSPLRVWFDARETHVVFPMDKVVPWQIFFWGLHFSLSVIPPMTHTFLFHLRMTRHVYSSPLMSSNRTVRRYSGQYCWSEHLNTQDLTQLTWIRDKAINFDGDGLLWAPGGNERYFRCGHEWRAILHGHRDAKDGGYSVVTSMFLSQEAYLVIQSPHLLDMQTADAAPVMA